MKISSIRVYEYVKLHLRKPRILRRYVTNKVELVSLACEDIILRTPKTTSSQAKDTKTVRNEQSGVSILGLRSYNFTYS